LLLPWPSAEPPLSAAPSGAVPPQPNDPSTWPVSEQARVLRLLHHGGFLLLPWLHVLAAVLFRDALLRPHRHAAGTVASVRRCAAAGAAGLGLAAVWLAVYVGSRVQWGEAGKRLAAVYPPVWRD
jgi:hypothetical protein